jgi:2-polyprenyl-3-methyl-5-hydroxy-6-metoxy-1,4-benzoquinol methylase
MLHGSHPAAHRYKSLLRRTVRGMGIYTGRILPLAARQRIVTALRGRRTPAVFEFSMGLLDDLRRRDPEPLHRFLWSNHLAYAQTYEIAKRFGSHNINPTRHILCQDLMRRLHARGLHPRKDIGSVFDVGCSMGYLLRHIETEVFPSAGDLHGLDIDEYAIATGSAHLASLNSRVRLFHADMESAARVMDGRIYDLVLCCGVLMYVSEKTAQQVLRTMLSHARRMIGLVCLAHPERATASLEGSMGRASDGAFIHNIDRMIEQAGGRVVSSQRIGTQVSGSSPSHVIVAEPQR